jgi:hypothetical protein
MEPPGPSSPAPTPWLFGIVLRRVKEFLMFGLSSGCRFPLQGVGNGMRFVSKGGKISEGFVHPFPETAIRQKAVIQGTVDAGDEIV